MVFLHGKVPDFLDQFIAYVNQQTYQVSGKTEDNTDSDLPELQRNANERW